MRVEAGTFRPTPIGEGPPLAPIALDLGDGDRAAPALPGVAQRLLRSAAPVGPLPVLTGSPDRESPPLATVRAAAERMRVPLWVFLPATEGGDGPDPPHREPGPGTTRWIPVALPGADRPKVPVPGAAVRYGSVAALGATETAEDVAGIAIVTGSLLDAGDWERAAELAGPRAGSWIVQDPFAGGRFDGSALRSAAALPGPSGPAPPVVTESWFRPAVPFAFLPVPGRRTLAQAAVLYLLSLPPVAAVAIRADDPESVDEVLQWSRAPPLDPDTRERIVPAAAHARSTLPGRARE